MTNPKDELISYLGLDPSREWDLPELLQRYVADGNLTSPTPFYAATPAIKMPTPLIIAHRNGDATNGEHSLDAVKDSAAGGFAVELDVNMLSDGTLVNIHDATVDRTMDGTGAVNTLTKAQWFALRVDAPVRGMTAQLPTTVEQVFNEVGNKSIVVPEVKVSGATDALCQMILEKGLKDNAIVQSFAYGDCTKAVGYGLHALYLSDVAVPATLVADGVEYVGASTSATQNYVTSLLNAGIKVIMWTVNNRTVWETWRALGVHGMFTDDPWMFKNTLQTYDPPIPKDKLSTTDPYALKKPWYRFHASDLDFDGAQFAGTNEYGYTRNTNGTIATTSQLWAGNDLTNFTLDFDLRYGPVGAGDDNNWGSVAFGKWYDDIGYTDGGGHMEQEAYHFLWRRNGKMDIYYLAPGSGASQIVTGSGSDGMFVDGLGLTGKCRCRLTVTKSKLVMENLTRHTRKDVEHKLFRGPGKLSFNARGADAWFSNVVVTRKA